MSGYDTPTIDALGTALRRGGTALENAPLLLRKVLENGWWREFTTTRGDHVVHQRFEDFVTAKPLKGLGASMELVRRIAGGDPTLQDLMDQALQRPNHRPVSSDIITTYDPNPRGTSQSGALRRLRKDRPDLHAKVLSDEISAHGAMLEAGFRHPTATVRLDDPASTAATLRKRLTPEQRAELIRLLGGE